MSAERGHFAQKTVVISIAVLCSAIWGVSYPVVKAAYLALRIDTTDLASLSLFAGVRFTIAGALGLSFVVLRRRRGRWSTNAKSASGIGILGVLLLALFQTVLQYLFIFIGLANSQSSKGSILNQIGAFLLVVLTPLLFREEKLTVHKTLGCLLGFSGIVLINLTGDWSWRVSMRGEGFIVLSSLSAAIGYLISKRISRGADPVTLTGTQQLVGGLLLLIPGLIGGGTFVIDSAAGVALLAFLSASVAVVYVLWMLLLKYNDVSEVAVYKFGVPVVGVLASGILIGENILTRNTVAAMVLVAVGIAAVNLRRKTVGSRLITP